MKVTGRSRAAAVLVALMLFGIGFAAATLRKAQTAETTRMSKRLLGPIDIGFAQWMAQHHDQAILMSQIMMAKPGSQLGRLATAIQTKQLIEVGQMQGWLLLAGEALHPRSREMDWMLLGPASLDQGLSDYLAACRASEGGMPGMASTDELNALREQQGAEADRYFIGLMIRHHIGALPMAQFASKYAEAEQVRGLATNMYNEQNREMQYLQGLMSSKFSLQD